MNQKKADAPEAKKKRRFKLTHDTVGNGEINGVKFESGEAVIDDAVVAHALQERGVQVFDADTGKPAWE